MTKIKLISILNVGTKSQSDVLHIAAAREIMIRNPELVFDKNTSTGVNVIVGRFKEEHYYLDFTKLIAMVRSLCSIKQNMFSNREVTNAFSLLGTDDVLVSALDVVVEELSLFKESCEFFSYTKGL